MGAEQLVEHWCWICGRSFQAAGKRKNRICGERECVSARNQIDWIRRTVRAALAAAARCPFCPAQPASGSKYCARHQFLRERCPGPCRGNQVRRNEGQGGQPRYCQSCNRAARKRAARQAVTPATDGDHPGRMVCHGAFPAPEACR